MLSATAIGPTFGARKGFYRPCFYLPTQDPDIPEGWKAVPGELSPITKDYLHRSRASAGFETPPASQPVLARLAVGDGEIPDVWNPGHVHHYKDGDLIVRYDPEPNEKGVYDEAVVDREVAEKTYGSGFLSGLDLDTVDLHPQNMAEIWKQRLTGLRAVIPGDGQYEIVTLENPQATPIARNEVAITDVLGNPYAMPAHKFWLKNVPDPKDPSSEGFFGRVVKHFRLDEHFGVPASELIDRRMEEDAEARKEERKTQRKAKAKAK